MFRCTRMAPRAVAATTLFVLLSAAAASAQTRPDNPVGVSRTRRINASRKARMARNIEDSYSHRWEVSGGGGFLRFRTGEFLQKINQVNFFMSAARYFNPKLSVVADVRGMYGNANIPNVFAKNNVFTPKISEYTFTAGPQYRFFMREKYSFSANATAGVALSKFAGDAKGLASTDLGMWPDSNYKPVFTVSLISDYNIYNNLAVRVQPTYVGTTFGDKLQNNLGIEFGVTYRFGREK